MKKIFGNLNFKLQVAPIMMLALSDVAVFAFPSYMSNFLPDLHTSMGIHDSELSLIRSIYGIISLFMYLFAMGFADKFKCKTLILTGIFLMFILGLWYSLVSVIFGNNPTNKAYSVNFWNYLVIFIGFSVAIKLFYWAPLWKLVAMQGEKNQVSTMNGIEGSTNGFIGMLLAIVGSVFYFVNPKVNGMSIGFLILSSCYTLALISAFVLILRFVKEGESQLSSDSFQKNFKNIFGHAKNIKLWMYGFVVMGIYMFQSALSGYTDYLTNVFRVSAVIVFILGIGKTYIMRFVASFSMGKMADKSNKYILIIIFGLIVCTGLTLMVLVLPGFNNNFRNSPILAIQILAGINMVCLGFATWCLVTIRWSPIATELKIDPKHYSGAVAFISILAFTPDAFFQYLKSYIQSHHQTQIWYHGMHKTAVDQTGNQLILASTIAIGLIGFILALILYFNIYKLPKIKAKRKLLKEQKPSEVIN